MSVSQWEALAGDERLGGERSQGIYSPSPSSVHTGLAWAVASFFGHVQRMISLIHLSPMLQRW